MPAVKIFQQLRDRVQKQNAMLPAEKRAMFWFHDYATQLTQWQRKFDRRTYPTLRGDDFTKELVGANRALPGFFYFFMYDAKTKADLPYWDRFPFVLCLDNQRGRFRGLNFHYLDYMNRARLFDLLYALRIGRPARPNVRDIRMRIRATYHLLKISTKYRAFKPAYKEYLVPNVRTPLMKVGAKEWDVALFLPVEQFQKQSKATVWSESRKQIGL
jgi:hypothetical protein